MAASPSSRGALLSFGFLAGAGLGLLGGAVETIARPLEEPLRLAYVLGANGLLGAAWGVVAAAFFLTRRRDPAGARATILAWVVFPALAIGLGLFVNRVVLTGASFLSALSLLADAVVLVVAIALSWGVRFAALGFFRGAGRAFAPPALLLVAMAGLLVAGVVLPPQRLAGRGGDPGDGPELTPIILVSIDTMRTDRLSGGGEPLPTSPQIDRLVREGKLWPDAVTPSPGSAASHAALLTSRYPVSNGVWQNFSILDDSVETLAERLRDMGYRTGGFVTNTFLGRRFGFDQGFDTYVESGVTERLQEPSAAALFRSLSLVQVVDRLRYRADPRVDPSFEAALTWLRESDRAPFLFLHFMDVHSPYVVAAPWAERFNATRDGGPESPDHRNKFGWKPSIATYTAEIRHLDAKIGRLRRELERLGLLDQCVLILTTDHGENLVDHEPNFTHGFHMFESTLRVLAAVRAPGRVPEGGLDPRTLVNVDFLPTVANLLDWPASEDWEGVNVLAPDAVPNTAPDAARDAAPEPRTTFGQINRDFSVRTRNRKVVLTEDGGRSIFRLDSDPGETRGAAAADITAEDAKAIVEAEEALAVWLSKISTPLYTDQARSVRPEELSADIREKLRALGYLR